MASPSLKQRVRGTEKGPLVRYGTIAGGEGVSTPLQPRSAASTEVANDLCTFSWRHAGGSVPRVLGWRSCFWEMVSCAAP